MPRQYRCPKCRITIDHAPGPVPVHCDVLMMRILGQRTTEIIRDGKGWPDDDEQ